MWPRLLWGPLESMTENQQVCPRARVWGSCGRWLGLPRWGQRGDPRGRAFQAEPLPSGHGATRRLVTLAARFPCLETVSVYTCVV